MRCKVFHEILETRMRVFAVLGPQKIFLVNSAYFSRLGPLNGPVLRPRKGCNEPLLKTFTKGFICLKVSKKVPPKRISPFLWGVFPETKHHQETQVKVSHPKKRVISNFGGSQILFIRVGTSAYLNCFRVVWLLRTNNNTASPEKLV